MKLTHRFSRVTLAAGLAACLLIGGCANLAAIREFAATSSESAAYTRLVTEYIESPTRQKPYQPEAQHPTLERIAKERQAQREALLLRHRLTQEYMEVLGQLAADEAVIYDQEIKALGDAAAKAKFVDTKEADAFSAVTRVLFRAVADGWRRQKLAQLIEETNPHFQTVVGALRTIVRQGFAGDAATERVALEKHYTDLEKKSRDPAGIEALKEWRKVRLAGVDGREKAITAYAEILDKIGQGHERLYRSRGDLSAKALLADMKGYSKDLRKLFDIVKERL